MRADSLSAQPRSRIRRRRPSDRAPAHVGGSLPPLITRTPAIGWTDLPHPAQGVRPLALRRPSRLSDRSEPPVRVDSRSAQPRSRIRRRRPSDRAPAHNGRSSGRAFAGRGVDRSAVTGGAPGESSNVPSARDPPELRASRRMPFPVNSRARLRSGWPDHERASERSLNREGFRDSPRAHAKRSLNREGFQDSPRAHANRSLNREGFRDSPRAHANRSLNREGLRDPTGLTLPTPERAHDCTPTPW